MDLKWNKGTNEYKVIFIAGNEPFNQGEKDYKEACKAAISKGIIVNTIYCGNYDEGVQSFWKDGADLADGKYINIDSDQQIVHIETPFNNELVDLGQKLNETYIAYGYEGDALKHRQEEQDANAKNLSPSVMVERSITKGSGQYNNSSWDLVDAKKDGSLDLANIPKNQLPKEMQNMTLDEQKKYIEMKFASENIRSIEGLNTALTRGIEKSANDATTTLEELESASVAITERVREGALSLGKSIEYVSQNKIKASDIFDEKGFVVAEKKIEELVKGLAPEQVDIIKQAIALQNKNISLFLQINNRSLADRVKLKQEALALDKQLVDQAIARAEYIAQKGDIADTEKLQANIDEALALEKKHYEAHAIFRCLSTNPMLGRAGIGALLNQ